MSFSDAERAIIAESKKYEGWANYETWCYALWIDNERPTYEHCMAQAQEQWKEAADRTEQYWTRSECARYRLAGLLKDDAETTVPELEGVWCDLLRAALSEVDWDEVANHYLSDIEGYEEL